MSDILRSTGKIVYDPFRANKKDPFWCVVEVDREITRYYRWWLQREFHMILEQPAWDAHISIVRGERQASKRAAMWNKHQGERVDFTYMHSVIRCARDVGQPGLFYWIDVECPLLDQIRAELGLQTGFKYHLTIGRTYYENIAIPQGRTILI